jgi:hypothetical protein
MRAFIKNLDRYHPDTVSVGDGCRASGEFAAASGRSRSQGLCTPERETESAKGNSEPTRQYPAEIEIASDAISAQQLGFLERFS